MGKRGWASTDGTDGTKLVDPPYISASSGCEGARGEDGGVQRKAALLTRMAANHLFLTQFEPMLSYGGCARSRREEEEPAGGGSKRVEEEPAGGGAMREVVGKREEAPPDGEEGGGEGVEGTRRT